MIVIPIHIFSLTSFVRLFFLCAVKSILSFYFVLSQVDAYLNRFDLVQNSFHTFFLLPFPQHKKTCTFFPSCPFYHNKLYLHLFINFPLKNFTAQYGNKGGPVKSTLGGRSSSLRSRKGKK